MAIDVSAATPAAGAKRWRLTLDRADRLVSLGDYFRRLGLSPNVRGPQVIELETDDDEDRVEESVAMWVGVNGIAVQVERIDQLARPEAPEPFLLPPPRIGELLVQKGFITDTQLEWALGEARATSELLGVVLLRKQLIFEDELARTLSQQLAIPYVSIMRCGVNTDVARLLPYDVGMRAAAIPVRADGGTVQVAFADPTDPGALAAVRERLPHITVAVAELSDIKTALRSVAPTRAD